jgi:hypothetical protein
LRVVCNEVLERGRWLSELVGLLETLDTGNLIGVSLWLTLDVSLDILAGLLGIAGDIEGVAGSFGDGETIVESDTTGHGTEADDGTPHLVGSLCANASACGKGGSR